MGTRFARACVTTTLAFAALSAPAGAQGVSDVLSRLQDAQQAVSTTATTPTQTTAPTETAPTATAPAAAKPPADATIPVDPAAAAPAAGATPGPPAAEQPAAGVTDQPIDAAADEDRGSTTVPAVLIALGVVAALLLLGALAWAVARWFSWDPRWIQRWRHASREAAYRAAGVWADFTDWVRLGR